MIHVFLSSWRFFVLQEWEEPWNEKSWTKYFSPKCCVYFFSPGKFKKGSLWFNLKQFFSMYFTVLTVNWKVDDCCILVIFTSWFVILYTYLVEIPIRAFSLNEALKYLCVWVMNKGFQTELGARKSWAFSGFNSVYFSLSPMCFHVGKKRGYLLSLVFQPFVLEEAQGCFKLNCFLIILKRQFYSWWWR